jgi:glutaredoxin
MRFLTILSICFFFFSSFPPTYAYAQEKQILEFFHGAECPHCHQEKNWFPELQKKVENLEIREYEVWHDRENFRLWTERMKELGEEPRGVPTNIIGDTVIIGFDKQAILSALQKNNPVLDSANKENAQEENKNGKFWEQFLTNYSWPVMAFVLGIIDGFNPCAMWSLMILLGFLMTMENKKRRWIIGGVFLASSGILYGGALLAYLFGFREITLLLNGGIMTWLFRGIGLLAVISAGMSFYSFWMNKVECDIRNADEKQQFHQKMSKLMQKEDLLLILPGIIILAFSVNAVELLCSFAIPTAFIASLLQFDISLGSQLIAVGIYDFAYMLDDIIIFLIAMFTLSFMSFSPVMVRGAHLIGGIILLILGTLLIFDTQLLSTLFLFE